MNKTNWSLVFSILAIVLVAASLILNWITVLEVRRITSIMYYNDKKLERAIVEQVFEFTPAPVEVRIQ